MITQHHYEILLKKGDTRIELSSEDVYFISKQMEKWCQQMLNGDVPKVALSSPAISAENVSVSEEIVSENTATRTAKPETQPPAPDTPSEETAQSLPPEPQPDPVPLESSTEVSTHAVESTSIDSEQPSPAPSTREPLPEVATPPVEPQVSASEENHQPPESAEKPVETDSDELDTEEDFEAVMDSLMADLNPEESASASEESSSVTDASTLKEEADLSLTPIAPIIPEEPIRLPPSDEPAELPSEELAAEETHEPGEPVQKQLGLLGKVESFVDLCQNAKGSQPEEYLVLAGYYLKVFESSEKFSLKHINSLMVRSGLSPINHSVLESSLSKDFLTLIPDLTGMADVTEYTLTDAGHAHAEALL